MKGVHTSEFITSLNRKLCIYEKISQFIRAMELGSMEEFRKDLDLLSNDVYSAINLEFSWASQTFETPR